MAISRVCYANREAIKARLDVKTPAYIDTVIDEANEAAADDIDELCHRVFYPTVATREVERTTQNIPTATRLWLPHGWELASLTSLSVGGEAVTVGDLDLYPKSGPPYNRIHIKSSSSASFYDGDDDEGADIAGTWAGCRLDTASAGTLAEALDASETGVDVSNSAAVGVGDLIVVDSERMLVTGRTSLDTGQTLGGSGLTAEVSATAATVSSGAAFAVGELLTIGTERMRVDDITGNVLTVKRAADGSVLAAHSAGTAVYAPRTLTVAREAYGTTAATHTTSTAVARHVPPALVRKLGRALSEDTVLQELAGYARSIGSGESEQEVSRRGITALRREVYAAFGRKLRHRAV
jgi:hypothetical protein